MSNNYMKKIPNSLSHEENTLKEDNTISLEWCYQKFKKF